MKCKHSWVNYFWRVMLMVYLLIVGILSIGSGTATGLVTFLFIDIMLAATILIDQRTNFLEADENFIKGRTGLIKKHNLSSPVNRLDYCKYKTFLIWNSVKIATGSSVFQFKNVVNGQTFVDTVNNYIVQK